jgi:hypothetical protein
MQIKSCLPFSNSNPQFKPTNIIMSAIAQNRMKYWEIVADNFSKTDWSWGWVSALDSHGRTIWIVDAHRDDGKRFIVRADEKLTAFLELEAAIRAESDSLRRIASQQPGAASKGKREYLTDGNDSVNPRGSLHRVG